MILELQQGPFEGMSGKRVVPPNTAVKAHSPPPFLPAKCFWCARTRTHAHTHTHTIGRGICWVSGCDLCKMCSLCPLIQLSKDLLQQLLFSLFPSHFSLPRSLSLNFSSSLPHWFSLVCQRCCFLFFLSFLFFFFFFLSTSRAFTDDKTSNSVKLSLGALWGHFTGTFTLIVAVKDYHG